MPNALPRQRPLTFVRYARNITLGRFVEFQGQHGPASMPERTDKLGRVRSVSKMTKEDAKRLRESLRRADPADMSDPSARERVGEVIAKAKDRPFKR
jgi:hypothetical protein